jgi:hypothetical protein
VHATIEILKGKILHFKIDIKISMAALKVLGGGT